MNEQLNYLQNFTKSYIQKTNNSKQIAQNYRSVFADPRVVNNFNTTFKEMSYPIVGQRALGSKIWDIDGNEYIDLMMGFGINLFGHNPSFIQAALQEQLEKGFPIGPQAEFAGEVAELICELTGMERVAISNTGTEAVMTAIRIARAATKRQKIVIFSGSYHGHFDGTLVDTKTADKFQALPSASGVLPNFVADVLVLEYGNFQSLEIIKNHQHELAAVLVEPVQSSRPNLQPKEFLKALRQLTQAADIALIFDEMVTGFRIHLGGAQAWFDVKADIATYGKIVGGGLPIGIIAGSAIYLDKIDGGMWNYGDDSYPSVETTFFAGTHCKHPLSLASARAVLQYLKQQGTTLQEQLNQRTSQFIHHLNLYFAAEGLPIQMANFGSLFAPASTEDTTTSNTSQSSMGVDLLTYHLLHKGILLRGGGNFLSTAHTDDDIQRILFAVKESITDLQAAKILPTPSQKLTTV
jgi:glutamate-1-semialdehyde aminotransferase